MGGTIEYAAWKMTPNGLVPFTMPPVEVPDPQNWDWADLRGKLGYTHEVFSLGDVKNGFSAVVYRKDDDRSWLVDVHLVITWESVVCDDFPALLAFLQTITPLYAAARHLALDESREWHLERHRFSSKPDCIYCDQRPR